jgi:hypothetical protein
MIATLIWTFTNISPPSGVGPNFFFFEMFTVKLCSSMKVTQITLPEIKVTQVTLPETININIFSQSKSRWSFNQIATDLNKI